MSATLRTISYRTAAVGAGAYTSLADETASPAEIISGFRPSVRGLVQSEPLYGAAAQAVFARGNRLWTLSFTVNRQHASPEAAAAFLDAHATALPDSIDLKIVQGATTTYLAAAVLTSLDPDEPTGASTNIRYQFTGPNYTETAP